MRDIYDVIKRPVVTEKSTLQKEGGNKVVFRVGPGANKREIKAAVEKLFNVSVVNVNTLNMSGKMRRVGRNRGKSSDWKKAVVTLKEGDAIEYFEGV